MSQNAYRTRENHFNLFIIRLVANFCMKTLSFVIALAIGLVVAPGQAKRAWNGPDLHGINPEAAPTVIHASPESKTN
jgi:hypothetical protein